MCNFETLFNELLQSLQDNKMDDEYMWGVLRNADFVVLLKSLFECEENSDKSSVYVDCLRHGFRVCDLQKAYCWLTGEWDDTSCPVCPQVETEPASEGIPGIIIDASVVYEQEAKATTYFFLIKLNSVEDVYDGANNSIIIQSNLYSVAQIIKETENLLGHGLDQFSDLNSDRFVDVLHDWDFHSGKIDVNKIERVYEFNDYIVCCESDEELERLYYFLRKYAEDLYYGVMFENCLLQFRSYVANLDEMFKGVLIEKVISYNNIVSQCKESGLYFLKDLLEMRPDKLSYQDLSELFSQAKQIETAKPADIFESWISHFKARELYVIGKRYFGAELLTLEEVGTECNVSRERIRQIEKKAITRMLSPKRISYRESLLNQLKLLSPHKSFITILELERLGIKRNVAIFLDKVTGDIIFDSEYNACFFSRASKLKLESCIEELPNEFTKEDLREYCILIADETKGAFTAEEVFDHILCKCKVYGEYISKSRITLKVVISVLMQKYFPDGIDLYEDSSLQILREKAAEEFDGFELAENNRAIRGSLQRFCVLVDRGIWKYDTEQVLISSELRAQIMQYIDEYNSPILPIQAILDKFAEAFNEVEICNKYALHGQLKKVLSADYSLNRDYVIKSNKNSFYDIIEAYIKQSALPVTRRDIQEQFPGITDAVISGVCSATKVINMNGYFVHLDNLNITDEEIDTLKTAVSNELVDGMIHHSNAVFAKIKGSLSGLFGRIGVTHYLQFYYLLHELFPADYEYNRPFIAILGVEIISGEAQVINLIMQQEECDIATIRQYAKEVGTIIDRYIEFVDRNNDSFIFKNRNRIISTAAVGLDEVDFSGLDEVLSEFMGGENYKLLSDFYNYRELPDLRCGWNTWLLYSVIKKYSHAFKLMLTSNFLSEAKPVLVTGEFDEQDIDLRTLAESDSEDSEQLLDGDDDMLDSFDYDDLE